MVLIGELARRTGVSARALRHYEERGLLVPARDANGYRVYAEADVLRVAQIREMIAAGLSTSVIARYLDCARSGDDGWWLELCPDLRASLRTLARRLDAEQRAIREKRRRLVELAGRMGSEAEFGDGVVLEGVGGADVAVDGARVGPAALAHDLAVAGAAEGGLGGEARA